MGINLNRFFNGFRTISVFTILVLTSVVVISKKISASENYEWQPVIFMVSDEKEEGNDGFTNVGDLDNPFYEGFENLDARLM
jgi:hypothetical protein